MNGDILSQRKVCACGDGIATNRQVRIDLDRGEGSDQVAVDGPVNLDRTEGADDVLNVASARILRCGRGNHKRAAKAHQIARIGLQRRSQKRQEWQYDEKRSYARAGLHMHLSL